MVKQAIQIFGRVKPTKAKKGDYEIFDQDGVPVIAFTVPKDLAHDFVNNKKEQYKFRFQKVFGESTKQDEIFENVAKPVVNNVLKGYNGTIFAYGQTGSGKTFTVTGGAEKYSDRGIIPRTLSYIYDYYKQNTEYEYSTYISYLEIYNENGYDLLDPKHEASKLEDLPKVSLLEDSDQNIHLKNLSTHQASNEEEALNLLFLGDTNRMIAETPMNQASTRSHCIFTIHITSREPGSATVRRSKLHLVDLAGSERVGKTGVNGLQLTEAKYINLSLHYLEQVIVALGEKARSHIPYRNSMMTSVLRDSLGGNCMTTMIATLSVEKRNIDETISTCRFAQRVALIKNDAVLNEELDPKLMIAKLKKEIQQLKDELALATGEQRTEELTEEDLERCREAVQRYLDNTDPDAIIQIGADMRKIHHCFGIMKQKLLQGGSNVSTPSTVREELQQPSEPPANPSELAKYKGLVQQRDNEINILVNMLKKEKKRAAEAIAALKQKGHNLPRESSFKSDAESFESSRILNGGNPDYYKNSSAQSRATSDSTSSSDMKWDSEQHRKQKEREERTKTKILGEMSMGRQEAFEIFRRDYHHNQTIEDNKALLKQKYAEAKSLGETVNQARTKINKLKTSIEQHRMSRVMQGLVNPEEPEADEMELEMKEQMENEKKRYKETFTKLRSLKTEIEHLQHLLEQSKVKLMKDFELWWAEQMTVAQEQQQLVKGGSGSTTSTRSAWRTPSITSNKGSINSSQTSLTSVGGMEDVKSQSSHHHGNQYYGVRQQSMTSGYSSQESVASSSSMLPKGSASNSVSISLTGDAQADADIMAFLKARQKVAQFAKKPR